MHGMSPDRLLGVFDLDDLRMSYQECCWRTGIALGSVLERYVNRQVPEFCERVRSL